MNNFNTSELPLKNFEKWERSIPEDLTTHSNLTPTSILWLKLASRNGYSREHSLKSINEAAPNSFLLAIAIRRMNDWVPQVRSTANEVIPRIISVSDPKHVVEALSAIFSSWNSWNRMRITDKKILIQCTEEPKLVMTFKSNLIKSTSGPIAHVMSQLGQSHGIDNELRDIATNAVQPSVRTKAYTTMLGDQFVWTDGYEKKWIDKVYGIYRMTPTLKSRTLNKSYPFLEILNDASLDRSTVVRKTAASHLIRRIEKYGDQLMPLAKRFSSDSSYSVSYRGKFAIEKISEIKKNN